MQVELECRPSFAVAYCALAHKEAMVAERGAMAFMSENVDVSVTTGGGLMRAAIRSKFGHEDFVLTRFRAELEGEWVAVAPKYPGDLSVLELDGTTGWLLEAGSFLAASAELDLRTRPQGINSVLLVPGLTLLQLRGHGQAVVSAYGGLQQFVLANGESVVIDSGHVVGWQECVKTTFYPLGSAVAASMSGEGIVGKFVGPGMVLAQTRSQEALAKWLEEPGSR